jgi:hypothetical protein
MLLASLYALYLMYLGLKAIKEPAGDKLVPYFVVTIVALIVIYWLVGFLVSRIAFGSMVSLGGFKGF